MGRGAASHVLDAASCMRWICAGLLLLAGCDWMPRDLPIAQVDAVAITESELRQELRGLIWQRGEAWDSLDEAARDLRRKEALDRRVDGILIDRLTEAATASPPPRQAQESEEAFQQFLKQFEPPDGWQKRFELQGVNEVQVRDLIQREVLRENTVETQLKERQTKDPEALAAEAREWYEKHREETRLPERARVSHLFLTGHDQKKPDRSAEIAALHRQLLTGETTLPTLAPRKSEDERSKKVGGSLGWIDRDRVPADFAEKVFTLPSGKLSEPFRTELGWHIALVHERQASRLPAFEEVKDEILTRLDQVRRETALKELMKELRAKASVSMRLEALKSIEP